MTEDLIPRSHPIMIDERNIVCIECGGKKFEVDIVYRTDFPRQSMKFKCIASGCKKEMRWDADVKKQLDNNPG